VKLADFGFACSFATEHMDDGTFKFVPVDLMSREQISMQVCSVTVVYGSYTSPQLIYLCLFAIVPFELLLLNIVFRSTNDHRKRTLNLSQLFMKRKAFRTARRLRRNSINLQFQNCLQQDYLGETSSQLLNA
jgi:hypothetical protein